VLEVVKEPSRWAANDPISRHLSVLTHRCGWNEECDKARYALEAELRRRGFIEFDGTPQHYGLWMVGEHLEYQVPADRQGHLAIFRGQKSRCFVHGRGITGAGTLLGYSSRHEGYSYVQIQEPS